MKLSDFFNFSKRAKRASETIAPGEYTPPFWEDDYLQIEIVPAENANFIIEEIRKIDDFTETVRTDHGYTDIYQRGSMTVKTQSRQISLSYFENILLGCQFVKAKHIRYDYTQVINCETGKTKAFGFPTFTIFCDRQGDIINNIWINHYGAGIDANQFNLIKKALHILGTEESLILIDWNSLELCDLANEQEIEKYLRGYLTTSGDV